MAGHGVFMNGMLLGQGNDHDNMLFALKTLDWLGEGPKGRRSRVFFLEDGETVTELFRPLTVPQFPSDGGVFQSIARPASTRRISTTGS